MSAWIDGCKTLTGIPLQEAFKRLDAELNPRAYKAISGGKGERLGLTDINPGFLPSVLMDLFGPFGVGWGFEVDGVEVRAVTRQRRDGSASEEFEASAKVMPWYAYAAEGYPQPLAYSRGAAWIPGGSDNSEREWAVKGAITNALGTAWFFMGYQVSVYQGLRSHNNLGKQPTGPRPSPESPKKTEPPKDAGTVDGEELKINELALKTLGWAKPHAVAWLRKYFGVDSTSKMTAEQKHDAVQLLETHAQSEEGYRALLRAYQGAGRCLNPEESK